MHDRTVARSVDASPGQGVPSGACLPLCAWYEAIVWPPRLRILAASLVSCSSSLDSSIATMSLRLRHRCVSGRRRLQSRERCGGSMWERFAGYAQGDGASSAESRCER